MNYENEMSRSIIKQKIRLQITYILINCIKPVRENNDDFQTVIDNTETTNSSRNTTLLNNERRTTEQLQKKAIYLTL